MDVDEWLRGLGLAHYAQAFRDNNIDGRILRRLTAEDLRELGVVSIGHRRQLLDAIAALREEATAALAPASPTDDKRDTAERRQVTVMFADLVGSISLAASMDPEDLREIIAAYHRCAGETVRRVGGFVSQYLGDGVLVYFGYPQAHEDDAERAVRASLDLIAAVAALKTRTALQTRVGVATGLVVVGDVVDAGGSQERGIIGETPNLAARIQAIAQPNTVVIAESTRRLLGDLFELQDLGTREVRGIAEPMRAWAALRARSVESRFEALHASGLTTLVGREEEMDLLLRRWSRAKTGEGQVVLLTGEPGIGKSRLTAALLERVRGEPHARLRYFCSPLHPDSAFYPIIGQMERSAALAHDDAPRTRLDKLDATLAQTSTSFEDAALIAEMLSLPNDGRYPSLELAPEQRRQRTMDALMGQLQIRARQNPVLMIFEDAHWADPTTLEVFGRATDRIRALRVLLIVTFRPEFDPPWIGQPHVTALTINRLTEREIGALIDCVIGDNRLPANMRQDIIERTDGVPLFVEEMTKAVLEAGSEAAEHLVVAAPSPVLAVPGSLHASLMARLDRLGPAKEVAQIGAAIGREFSHSLLATIMRRPDVELSAHLDRLITAGLLFRQGMPPHANYLFKHALVQDTAYGTLLREPRRALHARIANTLEAQFAETADNQPELLARHFTEAGQIEKAARFWGNAGQRSLDRSALVEATAQLTRALDQLAALPTTAALRRDQLNFQLGLVNALMHVKGYAASETISALSRARLLIEQADTLGEPLEDPMQLFSVLYGVWVANYIVFNGDKMREIASQFMALAVKGGSTAALTIAHRITGTTLLCTGHIVQGREHFERAMALYHPTDHCALTTRVGQDIRVTILSYRSWALSLSGHAQSALAVADEALRDARNIGHASTLMYALCNVSLVHIWNGNYAIANAVIDELNALTNAKGALFWKGLAIATQGYLVALTGNARKAIDMIASGIQTYRSSGGSTVWLPMYLSSLASVNAKLGEFDAAWRCTSEALALVKTTGESWYEAEVNRIAGEVVLLSRDPEAARAEKYFEHALTVARRQQAKAWELRAAISMAQLRRDQGKRDEARDLLTPVYDWFTEGFDTLDLKEAKALLDALAS